MALINCPECGKQISDKSKACIHCGFPLDEVKQTGDGSVKVVLKSVGNNKIGVIKVIREVLGLQLFEAKQLADDVPSVIYENVAQDVASKVKSEFESEGAVIDIIGGVPQASVKESAPQASVSQNVEQPVVKGDVTDIYLTGYKNRIEAAYIISHTLGLSREEAKKHIENIPSKIASNVEIKKAREIVYSLGTVGCEVECSNNAVKNCLNSEQTVQQTTSSSQATSNNVDETSQNMEKEIRCPECGSKNVRLYVASGFKSMLNVDIFGNKIEDGEDYICDYCSHKFKK